MPIFTISQVWNIPFFSDVKDKPDWAVGKSGHVSTKYFNYPLLTDPPKRDSAKGKSGTFSAQFGLPLLSRPRKRVSAKGKEGHVSTKYLPYPLLLDPPERDTAKGKSRHVSTRFFHYPLVFRKPDTVTEP